VDFQLTEEQIQIRNLARKFCEKIKPELRRRARISDPKERFPWPIIEEADKLGFRTLRVPKEYGGPGADTITAVLCAEEFAAVDAGFTISFCNHNWRDPDLIKGVGTAEQKAIFFEKFVKDRHYLSGNAFVEAGVASDYILPYSDSCFTTKAKEVDGKWVINGNKLWVTNGAEAKIIYVLASTDDSKQVENGTTMFMVPQGTPGMEIGQSWEHMGMRMLNSYELMFKDCKVGKENILGKVNDGFRVSQHRSGGALRAAIANGIARCSYEEALRYSTERVQGGKPIIAHQAIGMKLARMQTMIEASRTMAWRAAWAAENPGKDDPKIGLNATYLAYKTAQTVTSDTIEIMALNGILTEGEAWKCHNDASVMISAGSPLDIILLRLHNLIMRAASSQLGRADARLSHLA
jgi:alkylation response protein AidB-like acyl-CoA dehydrogenase